MTVDLQLLPKAASYSQVNTYISCGEQYKLERVYRIPRKPAWWFIGGSVFHKLTELYDTGQLPLWESPGVLRNTAWAEIQNEVKKALDNTDYTVDDIQAKQDGRWSADKKARYPRGQDVAYWLDELPVLVEAYIRWRKLDRWALWDIPEFGPAVEYPLEIEVNGIMVRGYLDRVFETGGTIDVVADLKSGGPPQSNRQLGWMAEMLYRQTGIDIKHGLYYNASSKHPLTAAVDLTRWRARFDEDVAQFRRGIEAGVFLPNESNRCGSCGVRDFCSVKGTKVPQIERLSDGSK